MLTWTKLQVPWATQKVRMTKCPPPVIVEDTVTARCIQPLHKPRRKCVLSNCFFLHKFREEVFDKYPRHCLLGLGLLREFLGFGKLPMLPNNLWIPSLPNFQPTIHNEDLNVDKNTTGRTIGNLNLVIFKDFGILNSTLFFQLHDITTRKIIQYSSPFMQTQIKTFIQITPLGSKTRLTREHNDQKENTNKC